MKTTSIINWKIGALISVMFLSCDSDPTVSELELLNEKTTTYYGPQVSIGHGEIRSWIRISHDNIPQEIGVEMTAGSLEALPSGHEALVISLHKKAQEITPFDHIFFNWNPHGHEPDGVFSVPHFDVHFVMTSVAERERIPHWEPGEVDALFNNYPPAGFMHSDYFTPPGAATAEKAMGKHWLPVNLEDFLPFSNILIYGSYDGKVLFIEPMNTLEFLNSKETFRMPFSQPEKFEKTSFYPTKYNVYYDPKLDKHYITLSDFVHREADQQ